MNIGKGNNRPRRQSLLVSNQKKKLEQKFAYPATIKMAKQHMKAARLGQNNFDSGTSESIVVCPCCDFRIRKKGLNVFKDHTTALFGTQNFHVISCVSLFFSFIKSVVIMLLIRLIFVDAFNIATNLFNGKYCQSKCSKTLWSFASIYHKYNRLDLIGITEILSFSTLIILIVYFILVRKLQYTIYSNIDKENQTENDFTIFVENIPILDFPDNLRRQGINSVKFDYDQDLGKIFNDEIQNWLNEDQNKWGLAVAGSLQHDYRTFQEQKGKSYSDIPLDIISSISLCQDISRIQKIREFRLNLMTKHQEQMQNNGQAKSVQGVNPLYDTIPEKICFLNQTEIQLSESYMKEENAAFKITHFCGTAFISFKYQHYRDYILQKYYQDKKAFMMKGNALTVIQAPAPSDVLWQNLTLSNAERSRRVAISYVILFVFLFFAFAVLLGSDRFKRFLLQKTQEASKFSKSTQTGINWASISIAMITTVVTLIMNYILQIFTYGLTTWENHKTKADEKSYLVTKLLITQFVNTAMIYMTLSLIDKEDNSALLSKDGLVYQISYLLVLSGAIQIGTNLLNFSSILRFLKLKWIQRKHKGSNTIPEYQINLNKKYEHVEFDIAQRYSYYLLQLYTVSFYAFIVPIVVPAVAIIFVCQYWVDKLNLFKRSSLFYELDYSLSRNILKIAECSIVVYSIGAFYFSSRIHDSVGIFIILCLIVSIIYAILALAMPPALENRLFQSYQRCEIYSYSECKKAGKFTETYWNRNPATMLTQQENFVKNRKVIRNAAQDLIQYGNGTEESQNGMEQKGEEKGGQNTQKFGLFNNFLGQETVTYNSKN